MDILIRLHVHSLLADHSQPVKPDNNEQTRFQFIRCFFMFQLLTTSEEWISQFISLWLRPTDSNYRESFKFIKRISNLKHSLE